MPADDDPAARDRVRDREARRAALRLRAGTHDPRRAVPSRRVRARRRSPATSASRAATPGVSNGATGRCGIKAFPPGDEPGRGARGVVAAGRSPRARQGRRLSGRHQDDLLRGRRPLQPVPERRARRSPPPRRSSSSWCTTTSSRRPRATRTSCCPRRRSGSATTCTRRGAGGGHYAIFMNKAIEPAGECRNDLDICADLARRLGHRGLQRQDRGGVAARALRGRHRRLRHVPRAGPRAAARARGRGGLRARDPRSGAPSVHDAVRQDRDLLDAARGEPEPLRPRPDPADPHVDPGHAGPAASAAAAARRSRARARTRSTATSRFSRAPTATTCGSIPTTPPRAGSPTASACASSTTAAPPIAAGARDRPHRARRGLHQGRRLVHPGRGRRRHARLLPTSSPRTAPRRRARRPTTATSSKSPYFADMGGARRTPKPSYAPGPGMNPGPPRVS